LFLLKRATIRSELFFLVWSFQPFLVFPFSLTSPPSTVAPLAKPGTKAPHSRTLFSPPVRTSPYSTGSFRDSLRFPPSDKVGRSIHVVFLCETLVPLMVVGFPLSQFNRNIPFFPFLPRPPQHIFPLMSRCFPRPASTRAVATALLPAPTFPAAMVSVLDLPSNTGASDFFSTSMAVCFHRRLFLAVA